MDQPGNIARQSGRRLFGADPTAYDDARPDYPTWIFDRLRERNALRPGTSTLEIGPGSGLATRRLIELGARPLTLIEPDRRFLPHLEKLTRSADVPATIICDAFEDCVVADNSIELVICATAFHWIDPALGLRRIRQLLLPGGHAALFWNVYQILGRSDPFHDATSALLSTLSASPSGAPDQRPFALDRSRREAEARQAGFAVEYSESQWSEAYDTDRLIRLYASFSGIAQLPPAERRQILNQLKEIADKQFNGRVERNVTSCLYLLS